jgi:hypothetical protein
MIVFPHPASSDLAETAKEISQYIGESGSADATIVASDEV